MILRQAAFEKPGTFLKGGLHCHTSLSDGKGSPEATVRHHASMGYDFYVEDGYACIHCSPVDRIILRNYSAPHRQLKDSNMTGGQIKIRDCCTDYIRMEVVDAQGRRAWTNPIFF